MTQQELRQAIESTAQLNGLVTDEGIRDAARNKKHPLHADPEWLWDRDDEAAERWRLHYAGVLRRKVFVVVRVEQQRRVRVPCFVRAPQADEGQPGLVATESTPPASASAGIVLLDEMRRVTGILHRARVLAQVLDTGEIAVELAELLVSAKGLQARLEAVPVPMASAARRT